MGSPLYMSPEQMRSLRDVDAQTDIWALGIVLFELIAGRAPFQAGSVTELAIKIANEPTPAIRRFCPDVPEGLEAILSKCLEKDRRQRYRNVAELALALFPFAPKRAKASVERISGIIQAAGLSASALAVPPSPQIDGTLASPGTLPPLGRTTLGSRAGKTAVVGAGVGGAMFLIIAGSVILWKRGTPHQEDPPTTAVQPASPAVSQPGLTVPSAKPADTKAVDSVPNMTQTGPDPVATPGAAIAARKKPPASVSAAPATPVSAERAPAAANCDPPYYYNVKGTRVFKPECL
jgi:serine/threonine protein kinase